MVAAVQRRMFDQTRDARRHAYLTDDVRLFEVVGVRGFDPTHPERRPERRAALCLVDARLPVPGHPLDELEAAAWFGLERVQRMFVVIPEVGR